MATPHHSDIPRDSGEYRTDSVVGNDIAGGVSGAVVQANTVVGDVSQHPTDASGKYVVDARGSTGVQVGDGNVQNVNGRPRSHRIEGEQV